MKAKAKIPEYGVPDEENPEWTAEDFQKARPIQELLDTMSKPRETPKNAPAPEKRAA